MSLLKDVRLLLIVALALLSLIALKMCSTAYQTTDNSGISSNTTEESSNTEVRAATETAEVQAIVTSEPASETVDEKSTEAASVQESETTAPETTAVEDASESTTVVAATEESVATATGKEESASEESAIVSESAVEDTKTVEAVAAIDETATDETVVTSESAETVETTGGDEAATAEENENSAADADVTEGVNPLDIEKPEPLVIEKIVLPEPANTGEFVGDFKTDVGTVQNGLDRYSEKLDKARSLLDKLSGTNQ